MTPLEKRKPHLAAVADDWEKQENSIDVDAIHCHRCGILADDKKDLLTNFFHRSDECWADKDYEIVCRTCRDEMIGEN